MKIKNFKNTYLVLLIFWIPLGLIYISTEVNQNFLSVLMFFLALIYSTFLQLLRENFKEKYRSKWSIIVYNACIDLVPWSVAYFSMSRFIELGILGADLKERILIYVYLISMFLFKYVLTVLFDIEGYTNKNILSEKEKHIKEIEEKAEELEIKIKTLEATIKELRYKNQ